MESLQLEGDIGGGLAFERQIYIPKENPKTFRIDSSIVARSVGAGSGGFSRLRFLMNFYKKNKNYTSLFFEVELEFSCATRLAYCAPPQNYKVS